MRTLETIVVCAALFAAVLAGCGTTSKEIQIKSQSERSDVFSEIEPGERVQEGFADLLIAATIKTPLEGYYIFESKKSRHGKPGYPFLVNIDGQQVLWKIDGVRQSKPPYNKDGKTSQDPEAGEGMEYVLEKELRLYPGVHRVFFSLPEENYFTEVDVNLKNGEDAILEFKPIYRYKTSPMRIPTFLKGVEKYEAFLNGKRAL